MAVYNHKRYGTSNRSRPTTSKCEVRVLVKSHKAMRPFKNNKIRNLQIFPKTIKVIKFHTVIVDSLLQ